MRKLFSWQIVVAVLAFFVFTAAGVIHHVAQRYPEWSEQFFSRYIIPTPSTHVRQYPELSTLKKGAVLQQSEIVQADTPYPGGGQRRTLIYLPKGYRVGTSTLYPTLYLLHGAPGREMSWITMANAPTTLDKAIATGAIVPLIAVFPNGNGDYFMDSEFINSADGKFQNETYVALNVVDYINSHLPVRNDRRFRAIGGLSSGAFGAINIGLKHQDRFGQVVSLSGYGRVEQNFESQQFIQDNAGVIAANSPLVYIPLLKQKDIKIWLSEGKGSDLLGQNEELNDALTKNGFSVVLDVAKDVPGHSSQFWSSYLTNGLTWLGDTWREIKK